MIVWLLLCDSTDDHLMAGWLCGVDHKATQPTLYPAVSILRIMMASSVALEVGVLSSTRHSPCKSASASSTSGCCCSIPIRRRYVQSCQQELLIVYKFGEG